MVEPVTGFKTNATPSGDRFPTVGKGDAISETSTSALTQFHGAQCRIPEGSALPLLLQSRGAARFVLSLSRDSPPRINRFAESKVCEYPPLQPTPMGRPSYLDSPFCSI